MSLCMVLLSAVDRAADLIILKLLGTSAVGINWYSAVVLPVYAR